MKRLYSAASRIVTLCPACRKPGYLDSVCTACNRHGKCHAAMDQDHAFDCERFAALRERRKEEAT